VDDRGRPQQGRRRPMVKRCPPTAMGGQLQLGGGTGRGELGVLWLLRTCDVVASPGAPVYEGSEPRVRRIYES
jgi:hypothetical protein